MRLFLGCATPGGMLSAQTCLSILATAQFAAERGVGFSMTHLSGNPLVASWNDLLAIFTQEEGAPEDIFLGCSGSTQWGPRALSGLLGVAVSGQLGAARWPHLFAISRSTLATLDARPYSNRLPGSREYFRVDNEDHLVELVLRAGRSVTDCASGDTKIWLDGANEGD